MSTIVNVSIVAAIATLADAIWYTFGVRHTLTAGVIHGAVVFAAVGGALGAASGRMVTGLPVGTLAGVAGAASYYALATVLDQPTDGRAILIAWMLTWGSLAALEGRWLRAPDRRPWRQIGVRGLTAAVGAGLAFSLVMGVLWGPPPEGGRNYLVQFLAWVFAWGPGIAVLALGQSRSRVAIESSDSLHRSRAVGAASPVDDEPEPLESDASLTGIQLLELIDRGETVYVLDVRSEGEYAAGHVPGAVNVPFTQVAARMDEVPGTTHDILVVYCGHGPRAYIAASSLRRAGRRRITYMSGHWASWQAAGLRVER